jgi:hypothetical protein
MGRAAKMAIDQYQGEVQPGAQKQDMSKGGPKQTPRKHVTNSARCTDAWPSHLLGSGRRARAPAAA